MDQSEHRNKARALAIEAGETWIDQWDGYEGSVVTGFVLIVETTRLGHPPNLTWMTGDGNTPIGESSDENIQHGGSAAVELGPLPAWRVRGMCGDLISQLDGREAEIQRRNMRDG